MPEPYNVLLITADHMRHEALGCNGNPFVETPHLDGLAARGVTFANSFTPNPICVPGRASITTGCYSHRATGSKDNGGRIRDGQPTIAGHFAAAGYATYAIGKLHYVPYSPPGQLRLLHGFQHAELCEEGRILAQFDPHGEQRGLEDYHDYLYEVGWGGYERAHGIGNNDVHPAPSPLPAEHHEEAWVATRTLANLREHLARNRLVVSHDSGVVENGTTVPDYKRPFFCWASFAKPHSPYDPPEPYHCRYDPRALPPPIGSFDLLRDRDPELRTRPAAYGWDRLSPEAVQVARAYYYGLVTFQDAMIGRILAFLDEAGLTENTVLIYTSDHGDLLGDFGCFFKCSMLQGSVGVPLLIAGPGVPAAGAPREQLVGLQDLLPTVAALTGLPLRAEVDGMDLSECLYQPDAPGREYYVSQSLSSPQQKYMVRTREWKYLYTELGGTEELYDVVSDRAELRNLAGDPGYRSVVTELRDVLIAWCREHGDEAMLDGDGLKSSPADAATMPGFQAGRMGWRWY
jgi:arylsulfatase A-like enzyme